MENGKAKEIFLFQLIRSIINLYKRFLNVLENNYMEHQTMVSKLKLNLPLEYHSIIDNANYFNQNKFIIFRKQILDAGNDTQRELSSIISNLSIEFTQEEVDGNR